MRDRSFYIKLNDICKELNMNPRDLLLVMSFESGVNPMAHNPAGATGLIQFRDDTLRGLGANNDEVANFRNIPANKQLDYVKKYIEGKAPIMKGQPFKSAAQYYHANFFPATLKRWNGSDPYKNSGVVVVSKFSKDGRQRAAYAENRILDTNNDGYITVADIIRTLAKTAQGSQFQNDLARLNSVAGEGSVSEFANGIPHTKKQPGQPDSRSVTQQYEQTEQSPEQNGIINQFIDKLDSFVSKLIGASHIHLLAIQSNNDIASKIEYARILKSALNEELGINSNIYTNQDNVDLEIMSDFDDYSSEKAIIEIANAVSETFTYATKKFATLDMKNTLMLNTKSVLPELDAKTATQQYRVFNLKIIKGQNGKR